MALDPVYYPKVGGERIGVEKRTMTKEQRSALKACRDILQQGRLTDDDLPLDTMAEGIAAYLEARKPSMVATRGQAIGYALDDEILDLREE